MDQLTDNMAAAMLKLTPEETQLLDQASEPPTPDYPYGEPGQSQRSRRIRGGRCPNTLVGAQRHLMQAWLPGN